MKTEVALIVMSRLEGLLKIPIYKSYITDKEWYITDFTKEQMFGSISDCIDLLRKGMCEQKDSYYRQLLSEKEVLQDILSEISKVQEQLNKLDTLE